MQGKCIIVKVDVSLFCENSDGFFWVISNDIRQAERLADKI